MHPHLTPTMVAEASRMGMALVSRTTQELMCEAMEGRRERGSGRESGPWELLEAAQVLLQEDATGSFGGRRVGTRGQQGE